MIGIPWHDSLIAHHAYASHLPQRLDQLVSEYLTASPWKIKHGRRGQEEKGALPKDMTPEDLTLYNGIDCRVTALAWDRMQPDLDKERAVYDHDMALSLVCQKMVQAGMGIDFERKKYLSTYLKHRANAIKGELRKIAGRDFQPSKPASVREVLFDKLGARPTRFTPTGIPSTGTEILEVLAASPETEVGHFASLMLRWRLPMKIRSTYIGGANVSLRWDEKILNPHTRRAHYSWKAYGTECMPAGELVLTSRGYLSVEKVRVGDSVLTHKGRARRAVAVWVNGESLIYTARLSNGLTLRTTSNHPYLLADGTWCRADKLQPGDAVSVHSAPEEWRAVAGWPYEVSSWGRVRNALGEVLTPQPKGSWGHLKVCLSRNGAQTRGADRKDFPLHRLVASAFLGAVTGPEVRHLNGIAWDNTVTNLAYGTVLENRADAVRHGSMRGAARKPTQLKLTDAQVEEIRASNATCTILGRQYGVSRRLVRSIRQGTRRISSPPTAPAVWASASVVSVVRSSRELTYALEIEEDHSHVTGGVVTHNTGRLASRIQSCPRRETGPEADYLKMPEERVREIYAARPGCMLVYWDVSQAEARIAAFLSADPVFMLACKGDVHANNAKNVFKEAAAAGWLDGENKKTLGKKYRDIAKNLGFAIAYGAEAEKLYFTLQKAGYVEISYPRCVAILAHLRIAYRQYYKWAEANVHTVRKVGYMRSPFLGRIRHFGHYPRVTEVYNYPIQSGLADIMNRRMIWLDPKLPRGSRIVAQIHDACIIEVPEPQVDKVKSLINESWDEPIETPGGLMHLPIDLKVGQRWSDF